jgi:hypothetical protein
MEWEQGVQAGFIGRARGGRRSGRLTGQRVPTPTTTTGPGATISATIRSKKTWPDRVSPRPAHGGWGIKLLAIFGVRREREAMNLKRPVH